MRKGRDLLKPTQRELFMRIPDDFSDRDITCYYSFSPQELAIIKRQNGARNRLGFAVQLAVLRFPGRTLNEITYIPDRVLNFIAEQVGEAVEELERYGERPMTLSEHVTRIRENFGYRDYGWSEMLFVARRLLPVAMETEQRLPLIEVALTIMRENKIIAPGMSDVEHLVWGVHRIARRRVFRRLTRSLTDAQRKTLESVPKKDSSAKGRTRLGWLRAAPGLSSKPENLMAVLNRIAYLQDLQLPPLPDDVPVNRIRQMARRCRQYKPQALRKLRPAIRRHALMVAYFSEMPRELTDQAIDMFDRMMADLLRKGDRQQQQQMEKNAPTLNATIQVLATAVEAFLKAYVAKLDPFATVFDAVSEPELIAALQATKAAVRPPDMDSLDLIEDRYARRRKTLLFMYRLLKFSAVRVAEPVLRALNHILKLADSNQRVVAVEQKIKDVRVVAPVAHMMKTRWKKHALKKDNQINANYYELAAFDLLKARLRSGDIAVENSRRYQEFYKGMLSVEKWQELKATNQTRLAIPGTAQQYFDEVHQHFTRQMKELTETFATNPALRLGEQGELILVPYETDVPEAAKKFGRNLYKRVPVMQIPDLALEVHGWTKCLDRFTDAITNKLPTGRDRQILLAALLALGMNIGFKKMSQATGFSYSELSRVASTYIREETIRRALRDLDNFALTLPMATYWGDGTATSSDGMRVVVAVKAANADYNARYFGNQRGLTFLTHTADIQIPLSPRVISTNERQALYTIDLMESHETDFNIEEHYTDTAGYTFHVFAVCAFLGYRFAPSIRSMPNQYLYSVEPTLVEDHFAQIYKGVAVTDLIEEFWDEAQRFAASIRHGTASAALMMRKLASYPRQNRLAQALYEIGKLERTLFILDYLTDESLRKRVRAGLNKGELLHALARALFFGQRGELRERDFEAQLNRASCLMLLIGMISTWNSVYLQKSWETTQIEKPEVSDEYLPFVSPLRWEHINVLGQYHIDPASPWSLDNLRPLRSPRKYQTVDDPEQP